MSQKGFGEEWEHNYKPSPNTFLWLFHFQTILCIIWYLWRFFFNNFLLFARAEMFLLSESCNLCFKEYITTLSLFSSIIYRWRFHFSERLWTKVRIICALEALLCWFSLFSSFRKWFTYGRMLSQHRYLCLYKILSL